MKQIPILIVSIFLSVPAFSQAFRIDDWYRLNRISDVQFNPNAKTVAFVLTRADKEKKRNVSQIWLVAAEGRSEPHPFSRSPQNETHPRWSPDGKRFAFLTTRAENERSQIYTISATGGPATRLTNLEHGVEDFVWSPDGSQIAVVSRTGRDIEPSDPLFGVLVIRHADYDQDGRGFLRDQYSHIFIVDARTGTSTQLTDAEFDDQNPAWSPDGKWIAFVADRTGKALDGGRNTDVFIVSSKGGAPRRVSPHEQPNGNPVFSPDGKYIAFNGAVNEADQVDLWMMPVDGGTAVNLTESFDERITNPFIWRDSGIYFTAGQKGDIPLFRLEVATKKIELIDGAARQISSFSIASNGTIAMVKSGFLQPADIHVIPLDTTNLRPPGRITDINRAFVHEHSVVNAEEFWYKADDGLDIEGWFVKPLAFDPAKKYPLILRIHGGPGQMYGIGFDHEVQALAARGYAVVFVNPRGSHGYGQSFYRGNIKDWGGKDYKDIMKGVDTILSKYNWLDPARMAVYGCSYGGFMTNWIITQTSRFAAAAPECSISNWINFWGTVDSAYAFEDSFGGSPWEAYELWWDRSPLKHARNVKTPSLFIHGEADQRTPTDQPEQMFRALKRFGVPTEFVRYPGENHGEFQNGKPAHYVDRIERILAWFDRYTKTTAPQNQ